MVQAQFRGVADKNMEQFRQAGKQVVVYPDAYKTGDVITPFEKARVSEVASPTGKRRRGDPAPFF